MNKRTADIDSKRGNGESISALLLWPFFQSGHFQLIPSDKKVDICIPSCYIGYTEVYLTERKERYSYDKCQFIGWRMENYECALGKGGGATITELTADLQGKTGWDKHIIITMLNRMTKKGAVSYRIVGRAKQFYPVVSRKEVSIRETRGFLDKVYRGSIGMMVNAMVTNKALTQEEIEELYKILEQAEKDDEGKKGSSS